MLHMDSMMPHREPGEVSRWGDARIAAPWSGPSCNRRKPLCRNDFSVLDNLSPAIVSGSPTHPDTRAPARAWDPHPCPLHAHSCWHVTMVRTSGSGNRGSSRTASWVTLGLRGWRGRILGRGLARSRPEPSRQRAKQKARRCGGLGDTTHGAAETAPRVIRA